MAGGYTGNTETKYFYEDLKIHTQDHASYLNPIVAVKSLATNNSMMRNTSYDELLSNTMKFENNNTILLTTPSWTSDDGKYALESYNAKLSLSSGNYSGTAVIRINDQKYNNPKWYYQFITKCTGVEKLYASINKKNDQQSPSEDDNKIVPAASGSGFLVSRKGHIITNHHVIEGCKTVKVNFKGDEIEAKILAVDKINDLAIIKSKINAQRVYAVSNEDASYMFPRMELFPFV